MVNYPLGWCIANVIKLRLKTPQGARSSAWWFAECSLLTAARPAQCIAVGVAASPAAVCNGKGVIKAILPCPAPSQDMMDSFQSTVVSA